MNQIVTDQEKQALQFSSTLKILNKDYLNDHSYDLVDLQQGEKVFDFKTTIGFLHLKKFVFKKDDKIIDKLSSVYSAVYSEGATLLMKLISDGNSCSVYLGIKKEGAAAQSLKVLRGALEGNFPGTTFVNDSGLGLNANELEHINTNLFENKKEITTVLGVPSLKNKEDDSFLQGLENLILGMQGKEFSALFVAEPIPVVEIGEAKNFYEDLYTNLSGLKEQTFNYGINESKAYSKSLTETIGKTFSESTSESNSISKSQGKTKSENKSNTSSPWVGKALINRIGGFKSTTKGSSSSTSVTNSVSNSKSKSVSGGVNENLATATSDTDTKGTSQGIQFSKENKSVTNALEKLDLQFDRLKKGESLGLWCVGAFFFSTEMQHSVVAANIFNGIIKGDETRVESSVVKTYKKDDSINFGLLINSLKTYDIPISKVHDFDHYSRLASIITTKELSIAASFPHKSFIGMDVTEVAPFGNNLKTIEKNNSISVGKLYNYEKEYSPDFNLDIEKFTGHIFVTGSTGSGKSNATYTIIKQLLLKDIKFMVIEPAKGEYKDVFGNRDDVRVLGTNPNLTQILNLNPFSFPASIHIYEHIDRLIEILNSCWPMEAAMPAFLKEAVVQLYVNKGWDLESSKNLIREYSFPTFKDLAELLPILIERSAFSPEIKGNYTGALVTRVKSMTNGILKLVFTEKECAPEKLFEENVIVDLSRVASSETKSLLMGILFMKLQEYRIATSTSSNSKLKHVTIIEEAHNLLKRTSSEQSQGEANLQGKSVEMISNAIAEMRTYGQGFILADQAPGLLDPSAIRNTNTKICLRLPFKEDRELVGKAMNLTDDQINELAKLNTGVAAVYQNDWQEAVLCKFSEYSNTNRTFKFKSKEGLNVKIKRFLAEQIVTTRIGKSLNTDLLNKLLNTEFHNIVRQILGKDLAENAQSKMLYDLLEIDKLLEIVDLNKDFDSVNRWNRIFSKLLVQKWCFKPDSVEFLEINNLVLKQSALENIHYEAMYVFNRNKIIMSN